MLWRVGIVEPMDNQLNLSTRFFIVNLPSCLVKSKTPPLFRRGFCFVKLYIAIYCIAQLLQSPHSPTEEAKLEAVMLPNLPLP